MAQDRDRQTGLDTEHQKKLERLRRSYERLDALLTELEDQLPALADTLGEPRPESAVPPRKPR